MTYTEKKIWFKFFKTHPIFKNSSPPAPLVEGGSMSEANAGGRRVYRQYTIDHFIVDFYIPSNKLVIEIDGDSHYANDAPDYDIMRTDLLQVYGLEVIRFTNDQVENEFEQVCEEILKYISRSCETTGSHTHPLNECELRAPKQQEIFYLTSHDTHTFEALVRPGKKFKVGKTIEFP